MKNRILAAAALLSLVTAGSAFAERPHVKLQELAASGLPQSTTSERATQLAYGQHPQAEINRHATQLAYGQHPEAVTNEHATQLAAAGMEFVRQSHGEA